ncbi:hypothetical protein FYK55_10950 [Roseiconus nitratireducens]|uniref:O-antigen/teichoic acid export membrane protein n=1 Tax=Roseiconus nitratireducens TaxID=2605748 RepID=A0A5M6D8M7_9BACT|nr:hypothetical protein [Roseiconus nitratireducens]KAA5543703.1 hypothetical protein FYK55_10950 [Roseiconus nitratireducens]
MGEPTKHEREGSGSALARWVALFQLDRTLLFALSSRVWQAASGPITIALVIHFLSGAEQGVYYSLVSIVGVQAFFELGLLNVLISQAGHAQAAVQADGPTDSAAERLRQLVRSSRRWFAVAAVLYAVAAWVFGTGVFGHSDAPSGWEPALALVVPMSAASLALSPVLALLEGIGQRQYVYGLRLLQMMAGSVAVWLALWMGLGLYALVAATAVQAICLLIASARLKRELPRTDAVHVGAIATDENLDDPEVFRWTRDVLPLQWRVAVISAAYHFATQLFPLILMTYHGSVASGRLGMTLTVTTAIQMLALSWVQTKYSVAARHHGAGAREVAGEMWRRTAVISGIVLAAGFLVLAAIIPALGWIRPSLPQRFIEPGQVLWLGLGALANHGVALQSFYVLSRGGRPFLVASLIGLLTCGFGVWAAGYAFGTTGIVVAYAAAMTLVFLPLHTWVYFQFRR